MGRRWSRPRLAYPGVVKRTALITVAAAALACAIVPSGRAAAPKPVPSLTPAATHRLWEHLVATRARRDRALARVADCRPARAIFYAATDWLRLATNLAQNASPCAQYYVT